eukprot:390411-Pyramimonas_sp.AAC.1
MWRKCQADCGNRLGSEVPEMSQSELLLKGSSRKGIFGALGGLQEDSMRPREMALEGPKMSSREAQEESKPSHAIRLSRDSSLIRL